MQVSRVKMWIILSVRVKMWIIFSVRMDSWWWIESHINVRCLLVYFVILMCPNCLSVVANSV